jgi:carboxypeptidase Q
MKKLFLSITMMAFTFLLTAQEEKLDMAMIEKIKKEGLERSQVMDIAFYLTDVNGPRLQGSHGYLKAANWSKNKLTEWGLTDAKLEAWGEWGRGWELEKSYLAMSAPYYKPIVAYPKAWTSGTNGLKQAEVIYVNAKDSADLQRFSGKLTGKILVLAPADTLRPSFRPDASRRTEQDLASMSAYASVTPPPASTNPARVPPPVHISVRIRDLAKKEGALAILSATTRGRDGTIFVQGGGSYAANAPENLLDMVIAVEDYNTIFRLVQKGIPVKLEAEVKTSFHTRDTKGSNVIAEIKGTDPRLKEELVMIGGHLDSWHSSTGATDNAAGCAVMMEALRILKAVGVKPRRTIRIALWGGEEQGLHGSRNYVRNHFIDTVKRKLNAAGEQVSVYFNLDNGTGKIRGIYAQENPAVKPIFTKWLEPFKDLGATTFTLQNTGGTDHLSFDRSGIPGFQFIQDQLEYGTRTHHTNMDSFDHLQADDLKQAATVIASFVYHAAQRDQKIPTKPQPATAGN